MSSSSVKSSKDEVTLIVSNQNVIVMHKMSPFLAEALATQLHNHAELAKTFKSSGEKRLELINKIAVLQRELNGVPE